MTEQKLSDAQIMHLWDTRVGDPTAKLPLSDADKLAFAREVEAATVRVCDARNPPRCSYCHAGTSKGYWPAATPAVQEERDAWQPIETAPKDGSRFLGFYDGATDFFHWQDFRDGGDSPIGWRDSFINVYHVGTGPTHWMPIPKAPGDQP